MPGSKKRYRVVFAAALVAVFAVFLIVALSTNHAESANTPPRKQWRTVAPPTVADAPPSHIKTAPFAQAETDSSGWAMRVRFVDEQLAPVPEVKVVHNKQVVCASSPDGTARVTIPSVALVAVHRDYIPCTFVLPEVATESERTITLYRGVTITGRVTDEHGSPIHGAVVVIARGHATYSTDDEVIDDVASGTVSGEALSLTYCRVLQTTPEGTFACVGITPGPHTITIRKWGYLPAHDWESYTTSAPGLDQSYALQRVFCGAVRVVSSCHAGGKHPSRHVRGVLAPPEGLRGPAVWQRNAVINITKELQARFSASGALVCYLFLDEGKMPGDQIAEANVELRSISGDVVPVSITLRPLAHFGESDITDVPMFSGCAGHGNIIVNSPYPFKVMTTIEGIIQFRLDDGTCKSGVPFELPVGTYAVEPRDGALVASIRRKEVVVRNAVTETIDLKDIVDCGSIAVKVCNAAGNPTSGYKLNVIRDSGRASGLDGNYFGSSFSMPCEYGKYRLELFDMAGNVVQRSEFGLDSEHPIAELPLQMRQ